MKAVQRWLVFRGFAFLIVELTFHGQWHNFGVLLGSHRCLANRSDANGSCSDKVATLFFQAVLWLHENCNFGTATGYHGLTWSWLEIVQCEAEKLQSCRSRPVSPKFCRLVLRCVALIWHFMCNGIFLKFNGSHLHITYGPEIVLPGCFSCCTNLYPRWLRCTFHPEATVVLQSHRRHCWICSSQPRRLQEHTVQLWDAAKHHCRKWS